MGTLTIRNLDDPLKTRLRLRAAARNRSMEEEARQILRAALDEPAEPAVDLATRIRARFASIGGVDLPIETREPVRESWPAGGATPAAASAMPRSRKRRR